MQVQAQAQPADLAAVDFVWEDLVGEEEVGVLRQALRMMNLLNLSVLPAEMQQKLKAAAEALDVDEIKTLVAQIGTAHPPLAAALETLVQDGDLFADIAIRSDS